MKATVLPFGAMPSGDAFDVIVSSHTIDRSFAQRRQTSRIIRGRAKSRAEHGLSGRESPVGELVVHEALVGRAAMVLREEREDRQRSQRQADAG